MNGSITISKKIKPTATLVSVGTKCQLKLIDQTKAFKSMAEAIKYCNVLKIAVENKESLPTFFQTQLIH
jgi:hypothetical protein